jgi:hypothetical protein
MDLRAKLLSVLAQELPRCRSCRSPPLFSLSLSLFLYSFALVVLSLSLLTVAWPSFYTQGDTTVARLHV